MSTFDVMLFLHLVGVAMIAGGAGVGLATGIAMPRTSSVRAIGSMSGIAAKAEHFAVAPGAVLTLLTGTWFILDDSGESFQQFDFGEAWLWLSYIVWVVAVGLGEGLLAPFNHRLHRQAESLLSQGIEESDELRSQANSRVGPMAGGILTLLFILFLYLMVFQPGG